MEPTHENPLADINPSEVDALFDEAKATPEAKTPEQKKGPEAAEIFKKAAEGLKQKKAEEQARIAQLQKEENVLQEGRISDLRARISGKKQVEITGEAAQKWQQYLETKQDLEPSQRGETTYGGTIEQPIEMPAPRTSEVRFTGIPDLEDSGERPAMFSLEDLAKEEAKRKNQPPAAAA